MPFHFVPLSILSSPFSTLFGQLGASPMPTKLLMSSRPPIETFQVIARMTRPSGKTSLTTIETHISLPPAMMTVPVHTPERMLRLGGTSTGGTMS